MNSSLNKSDASEGSSSLEFSIRVPKNQKKKFNIMRFGSNLGIDIGSWTQVKMERENHNKEEKTLSQESPKFGAGSEFRKEEKEEARRRRFGFVSKRAPVEEPWILGIDGKNGKRFRGVRGGGVSDNASYYIFMQGSGNIIEAHPVPDWYNFMPFQRYKTLTAEEAEQEYGKRNKNLAYIQSLMRKCLHKEEEVEQDEEAKRKTGRAAKDLKISEMDDWLDSDDDDDEDEDEAKDDDDDKDAADKKKKKAKKQTGDKKKKITDNDESALEESDDGDEEGRELDYISDSSDSVSDVEAKVDDEMKGVAEESGLRKLLASDDEDEDAEGEQEEQTDEESEKKSENGNGKPTPESPSQQQTPQQKKALKRKLPSGSNKTIVKNSGGSSDEGGGGADWETDKNSIGTSSESPSNYKPPVKKLLLDSYSSDSGISEEAVRRYLTRKPMTTTELLQKFKKPRTNLSSEQLVNSMTQILKKINPIKQTIKDKMYLSLKPSSSSST